MGLLDSLFGRGWVKCQKRGDNYSQQKQWGLARGEYLEALRLFSSKGPEDDMARLQIKEQLGLVHHHLLELYLEKAQALERNDPRKAIQVLSDALEFAPEDRKESLLQRVAELEMSLSRPSPQVRRPEPGPVVSMRRSSSTSSWRTCRTRARTCMRRSGRASARAIWR